jgi:hypothetical protein
MRRNVYKYINTSDFVSFSILLSEIISTFVDQPKPVEVVPWFGIFKMINAMVGRIFTATNINSSRKNEYPSRYNI